MIPRRLFVGEEIVATMLFKDKSGDIVEPKNSSYPVYVLRDIDQDVVCAGVASLSSQNGVYQAFFTIPETAKLSTNDLKYVIEWEMVSITGERYSAIEYTDVVNPFFDEDEDKSIQKIVTPICDNYFSLPIESVAENIEFIILDDKNKEIHKDIPIISGMYSDFFLYKATVAANILEGEKVYNVLWKYVINNQNNIYYQKVLSCSIRQLSLISDLRMYIDKFQKDINLYTGYRDSDLLFHIEKGLDIVNMVIPITNWNYVSFGSNIPLFILQSGAAYSVLRSQLLAEGDASFDYSGQPVSLSIDRTTQIEAELGRLKEWLDNDLKQWKMHNFTRNQGFNVGLTYPTVGRNVFSGRGYSRERLIGLGIPPTWR